MSEPERIDQEPEQYQKAVPEEVGKARRAFAKVRRELSEEELSSPAVHRLLLDSLDQLEQDVVVLSDFRDRFHECDKEKAVLQERLKTTTAAEVLYGVCLTIGSVLLGLIPFVSDKVPYGGPISLCIGVVLIVAGITSKRVRK